MSKNQDIFKRYFGGKNENFHGDQIEDMKGELSKDIFKSLA